MSITRKKLLVVQCAALGYDFLINNGQRDWHGLRFKPIETVFPAVTSPVQASFRTALPPSKHGIVGNGFLFRDLMKPLFWEQSARLVEGPRIWDSFRENGGRVGLLFWQQSIGESADCILTPAPIHKHHGGMIQSCYSKPADLYQRLCAAADGSFNLMRYWGPMASARSSDWIASATSALLADRALAPDLCMTYLPALDYDLQRYGPDSTESRATLRTLLIELDQLLASAVSNGYEALIFGDYAIGPVDKGAIFPNRALRESGLFAVRDIGGMLYPDFHLSGAFTVVDDEITHVYVRDAKSQESALGILLNLPGVSDVIYGKRLEPLGLAHPRSGNFVLVAADGYWFAYPWWIEKREEPDYAGHVDIHNKPGYDPCELFFGWPPFSVSRNTDRIRGSHGKTGKGRSACWASTCKFEREPDTLLQLAETVKVWLG